MLVHPDHPWIDAREAPLYVLRFPSYAPDSAQQCAANAAQQRALFESLREWSVQRHTPYAFVVDLRHLPLSTAVRRERAVAYLEHSRQRGNPNLVCRAFVADTDETRGVMTAVFWRSPPDYPYGIFDSVPAAIAWAREQLRHAVS